MIKGTTPDGTEYIIWYLGDKVKQGAKDFTVGAAKFAGKCALSLGKRALDLMDYSTFDIQGKRADSGVFVAGFDERDAGFNNPLAIMDVVGEEGRAKWK